MKSFKYILVYLLVIELVLDLFNPSSAAYSCRLDYPIIKDNPSNIDIVLENINREIQSQNLTNYIIILGDSVAFSGPGPSSESLGYYMQQLSNKTDSKTKLYNLSMPAMQTGDIYTMLLKLDEYHISTQHVILNIIYAGFAERTPDPPAVFWLQDDLQKLDYSSFKQANRNDGSSAKKQWTQVVRKSMENNLALFKYRDIIKSGINKKYHYLRYGTVLDDSLGDSRPWYYKKDLPQLLATPEYQRDFSAKPFDMSKNNSQIYFINKIAEHQKNCHTLIFLAGTNDKLMNKEVLNPGYQDNLAKIDRYLASLPIQYLNCQGMIDANYFTDHVHLTGEGYRQLAKILWDTYNQGDN